jgi:DNA repair exonuclease SbcCD nuclease subunit
MTTKGEDVALTLIHTADWHLGKRFPGFRESAQTTLMRARLDVLDRVFGAADSYQADAVLCAGDLFDGPQPERPWWEGLAQRLAKTPPGRPVFLLPGNHDPLLDDSVWSPGYGFRAKLPAHVRVVDRKNSEFVLGEKAVLFASPCTSSAGQEDLALALPARAPGDERIRIGMVHGSTFDMKGCQLNFPIAKDAAAQRGFDYLAIGDTHSFRIVPPDAQVPTVYPGAPEPTNFGEAQPGNIAVVFIKNNRRVMVEPHAVAYWRWEEAAITSLDDLRRLAARTDLSQRVLRLTLVMRVPANEYAAAERLLDALGGTPAVSPKVGILVLDRTGLVLDTGDVATVFETMPEGLREAARRLKEREQGPDPEVARRALYHLYTLARKV